LSAWGSRHGLACYNRGRTATRPSPAIIIIIVIIATATYESDLGHVHPGLLEIRLELDCFFIGRHAVTDIPLAGAAETQDIPDLRGGSDRQVRTAIIIVERLRSDGDA